MATQALNHSNVRVYPNPIPINGYLGRAYTLRAATARNILGNTYPNRAVVDRWAIGKSQSSRRAITEPARAPQAIIERPKAGSTKKDGASERVRYIRLMMIIETANVLCLYGVWQLWHMIH